jgi:hypothetical protein
MPPLNEYLEQASELSQEVVDAWALSVRQRNSARLTERFNDLVDKACRFRTAKEVADNYRQVGMLSGREASEERQAREEFAHAYKVYWEETGITSEAEVPLDVIIR